MTHSLPVLLQVEIADVGQHIFSGLCRCVIAPASMGEVCILPRHTPFLTKLLPGVIQLDVADGEREVLYVSGGYMEALPTSVTVLADCMLRSEQIDREAALEAKRSAEDILRKSPLFTERDRAKLELVKALAQLRVLEQAEFVRLHKHPQG